MRTLFLMVALFIGYTAQAQEISFETTKIDYGILEQDANGIRYFNFTNTGEVPLIISRAKGSCGCTVPTPITEPILPGESAKLEVKYDTHRIGQFTKYVTVYSNAKNQPEMRLSITGEVQQQAAATPAKERNLFSQ